MVSIFEQPSQTNYGPTTDVPRYQYHFIIKKSSLTSMLNVILLILNAPRFTDDSVCKKLIIPNVSILNSTLCGRKEGTLKAKNHRGYSLPIEFPGDTFPEAVLQASLPWSRGKRRAGWFLRLDRRRTTSATTATAAGEQRHSSCLRRSTKCVDLTLAQQFATRSIRCNCL